MSQERRGETHDNAAPRDEGSRNEFDVKQYNSVVATAELRDIKLISSRFDLDPDYLLAEDDRSSVELAFGGTTSMEQYIPEDGVLGGRFDWEAFARYKRKRVFKVKSSYLVVYSGVSKVEEKYARAFLRRVGMFATFPYFRALVASYNSASGAELPTLPVLREPPRGKQQSRR